MDLSDSQFNSLALVVIAFIGIVPSVLAAVWARNAKDNSAGALHEVKANGGMTDPDPTLKDYVKYVGENSESTTRRVSRLEDMFAEHIAHSKVMDSALAQVFVKVMDDPEIPDKKEDP